MQRSTWALYPLWSDTRHLFVQPTQRSTWTLYPLWSDTRHLFVQPTQRSTWTLYPLWSDTRFSPSGLKAQSSPFFPCCERKARYSTPVLLVTNKYYSCWIGVVDLPRDRHGNQLPINHQHTSYMYEVIRALRIWGGLRRPTFCIRRADNR
jgi:hypothetical protein